MKKYHNSADMAKQIAKRLNLDHKAEMALYEELSLLKEGPVKTAIDGLLSQEKETVRTFAACVKMTHVYNAEYVKEDGTIADASGLPLFLDIVKAETPVRARQMISAQKGLPECMIELYDIKTGRPVR